MEWFLIYFMVMGIVIGILPRVISNKIKSAIELDYWKRDESIEKVNLWLLLYSWAIILVSAGLSVQLALGLHKDQKAIDERVAAIEQVVEVQVDTVATQNDTINIKDVKYDIGGENSN